MRLPSLINILFSWLALTALCIAQEEVEAETSDAAVCSADLAASCATCYNCSSTNDDNASIINTNAYNCSLPGLSNVGLEGKYSGVQVNYLSFATETSSPNLPLRAKEFEACTGSTIVFSEASNLWEDPIRDLGTSTARGSELYDGYFMSYSYFPGISRLGLAEPLNDRIRRDAARLRWEDVLPAVHKMGEYRKNGKTNIDFLMYDGDFFVPIIRLDLLEQHNLPLPNTWEEVVDYAKYFNGTDLNDDGEPDYGFCHFPQLGAGYWDDRWAEALYGTWASIDQSRGIQQGFFFDEDTMEPRLSQREGFRKSAQIWKDLWTHGGEGCITPNFITGRCAIGFSPPGCWKGVFLDPVGVARKDDNGTVLWQPTMKNGDYAEPYRFRPFGSMHVTDPKTGELTKCTPKLCPKAERVPLSGHHGEDDRASQSLPPSPLAGQLINRVPFYWSGGLGTLIRKSAPLVNKDVLWDFFVYTNSPDTSVYDVANYASWLDSWRHSQLNSRDNFLQAGWSTNAYNEHVSVMNYALGGAGNGGYNLRLPSSDRYTKDAVGDRMKKYIEGSLTLDEMVEEITLEWNDITDAAGRLEQLEIYRSSLGLDLHSEAQLCRLHRELMDERDPSVCRRYDSQSNSNLLAVVVPCAIVAVLVLVGIGSFLHVHRQHRKADSLWRVKESELELGEDSQVIGFGSFGVVLLTEYRGTKVAVKKVVPTLEKGSEGTRDRTNRDDTEAGTLAANPGLRSVSRHSGSVSQIGIGVGSRSISRSASTKTLSLQEMSQWQREKYRKKLRKDFILEMRTLAKLRHPNITTTMGAVLERGGEPMLVMEYMENGSLYEAMRNESINLNSQDDILIIVQDIARGMRFLHSADVIHGDLKSKNVLIDSNFRAKVSDFGLSANAKDGARGTPYWMSPELLNGSSHNTASSDIYAFGILLYEVYARKMPYEGEDYEDVINGVRDPAVRKRPPVPRSCPPKVSSLMLDCLQHDAQDRPSTKDLDKALQAEGTVQGRIVRIEALNKDLVEENRQITTEQATQLGHFACMSHEIRTPLNCIIGVSSLLEDDRELGAEYKESVKMIVSSSKLLKQVVDDVLDFSKFVSGNADIDIQRTDLQETLMNIVRSMAMSPITERKEIVLRTIFDPRVSQYIDTDDRRLQQILYNLMSNAVKFSKDKNNVDLVMSLEESPNKSHRLQLQVKDYGKGIQKGDFEKVFQPFAQTEAGLKSVDGGTGLGLAITKQLTELLGGSIAVDSEFGQWTTFSVQFPLSGGLVDPTEISKKLRRCCIWQVGNMEMESQVMERACAHFRVKHRRLDSMAQLEEGLPDIEGKIRLMLLVQNDLYDAAVYGRIQKKHSNSTLLTFGPEGKMHPSRMHYNSLTQKFPVVIMGEFSHLHEQKDLSKNGVAPQSSATASSSLDLDNTRILVAEDNLVSQKVLTRMLERLGVKKENLVVTSDGEQAVEAESKREFDIIFMDIQMPVMDGLDACKLVVARHQQEQAKNGPSPMPKIVFLSANLASDYKDITVSHGATDYLAKPIGLKELKAMFEKLQNQ